MAKSLQRLYIKTGFEVHLINGFSGVRASYFSVHHILLYIISPSNEINNGIGKASIFKWMALNYTFLKSLKKLGALYYETHINR